MYDLAIGIRQQAGSRIVSGDGACQRREPGNGQLHVHGMEGSRDAEFDEPGSGRRIGGQRGQLILGARGDDLAAAIVVGRRQTVCGKGRQHSCWITANDGRHRGWGGGASLGHRPPALAYEDHRLLG